MSLVASEICIRNAAPVLSMRDAVFTVSPNRQYRGMRKPTTPLTQEPANFVIVQLTVHCVYNYNIFRSSKTWDRSAMHPKFDPTRVQTNDFQIMTVHFMSLRHLL